MWSLWKPPLSLRGLSTARDRHQLPIWRLPEVLRPALDLHARVPSEVGRLRRPRLMDRDPTHDLPPLPLVHRRPRSVLGASAEQPEADYDQAHVCGALMGKIIRKFDLSGGRTAQLVDHTTPEQLIERKAHAVVHASRLMGDTPESTHWRDNRLQEIHDYLTGRDGKNFRKKFEDEK